MEPEEAIQASLHMPETRATYTLESKGGYCSDVNLNAELGLVLVGYQKSRPGIIDDIRDYPFYRITYTTMGKVTLKIGRNTHHIGAGMIYLFHPGQSSFARCEQGPPWCRYFINFTGSKAKQLVQQSIMANRRILHVSRPDQIQAIMDAILSESLNRHKESQSICANYLKILLMKLASVDVKTESASSIALATYTQCKNFIDENFCGISSIQEISDKCALSRQHMSRLFKKFGDTSPLQYLMRLKLNRAAVMLLETNLPVKQISLSLNFSDQYYFSKCFKKFHGESPSAYRKIYASEES